MSNTNQEKKQIDLGITTKDLDSAEFMYPKVIKPVYDIYITKAYKNNKYEMEDTTQITKAKQMFEFGEKNNIVIPQLEPYSIYIQACELANKKGGYDLKEASNLFLLVEFLKLKLDLLKKEQNSKEQESKPDNEKE